MSAADCITHEAVAARVRRLSDRWAARYDSAIQLPERLLFVGGRHWVCSQAAGDVLELAVGTGRNLPHYPDHAQLAGIDISPNMLGIARQRARTLRRDVDLRLADAQHLQWDDETFDTVVSTLGLCSIPDERRAVAEAWRVLRPGGRLLLLEHVRSPLRAVRIGQELLEPLFICALCDHLLREPLDVVRCHGFVIDRLERSKWGIVEQLAAHKPPSGC